MATESNKSLASTRSVANARSPWRLRPKIWIGILKRVWVMSGFHELGLLSAGLAFYSFLALTPLIAATVMIYGLVGDVAAVQSHMASIVRVIPPDAAHLIEGQLLRIISTNADVTGLALAVALFFAVYGAMNAAYGMISALNIINEEHETRSVIALALRASGLTLAAVLIAITGMLAGGIFAWLQMQTSVYLGASTQTLFKALTWVAAITLGSAGFALIMRYGPDRRPAKWQWLMPGSVLATLLWIAVSFGFSLYVAYVSDYNATYGSLSAIVVFLMWLFVSAYGVLLGAVINAEIERQVQCDTTIGPEMPPGMRGAVLADTVDDRPRTRDELESDKRSRAARARQEADSDA